MALDDLDDRFGSAVKLALDALRGFADDESYADDGAGCPSADVIACYYENTLNRVERSRLETHFSDCARCQGTLAALLRAAPTIEPAPATGRFGAAAARRMAAGSGGARERWFEIGPAWRIARTTAVAAAVVAIAVVGGLHLYQASRGQESGQVVSFSATAQHHRHESHPSLSANQLALNENKSLLPAAPAAPKTAAAPSAAAAGAPTGDTSGVSSGTSPGMSSAASSAAAPPVSSGEAMARPSTSGGAAAPPQEAAPPVAPANTLQNEATAVAAAQAAAALGALAVTPAPAATTAPSIATPGVAAAAAPVTSAIGAGAATATPASETATPAAAAPGAFNPKKQEFVPFAALTVQAARAGNSGQPRSLGGPAAHDQLAREQSSKKKRAAELALKTELAKLDADMKRLMNRAQLEARAKSEKASSAKAQAARTPAAIASARPPAETPFHPQMAAASSSAAPPPAAASSTGNEFAMAEPPVVSAPVVATNARGIPVAPHALLISSADHSVYWSLQNSGTVYRSTDRKSWTPEATGIAADLLAGMAPSNTVCWAVGRKGVILLTTDGIHWERVNSPTTSDVIGITAASGDVATIFTASGVSYSTFDGGSNWEPAN